ncbi:MAG TPA: glycosyltransferase family 39 protein, partial [Roseiflexaceae bacterium]|nr:glycosyltransferase family 39 protein [Roseiflexaceae bacterium]
MTPHAEVSQLPAVRRKPTVDWMTWSLLLVVLALAWVFRSMNLYGWDGTSNLHPDERFIVYTAYNLRVPGSFGDYLRSSCVRDGVLPEPQKTQDAGVPLPVERQEPTVNSGCNTLNPRNYNWSRMFVYGTLPTSLVRVVAEARDRMAGRDGSTVTPVEIRDIGRTQSALFDMGSVLLVFLIGRRLYGSRAGLLAALFLATAALPIQLAHFFTVDAATGFFTLLSIYWAVRAAQGGGIGAFVMLGVAIGAAMACRITMATLGVTGMLAVAVRVWGERVRGDTPFAPGWWLPPLPRLVRDVAWLVVAGVVSLVSFRLLAPDSFVGTSLLDVRPEPRFLENIQQVSGYISGKIDAP